MDALGQGVPEKMLSERGIKGIKYLDGDSRAVGDGTSNYVIFDDSPINIAERGNAIVPMLLLRQAVCAALLASQIKDSGMISAPCSESLFTSQWALEILSGVWRAVPRACYSPRDWLSI